MKILKGCSVFIFSILLLVSLTLFITLLNVRTTFLSSRIPDKYIDQLDIQTVGNQAFEEGLLGGEGEEGGGKDNENINKQLFEGIDANEQQVIKNLLKTNIGRFFSYLNNPSQETLELSAAGLRTLLVDTIVTTPKALDELHLPFEVCTPTKTKDCVTQAKLSVFLDKLFQGSVTQADVLEIIPKCPAGTTETQAERVGCITQKQLNELELDKIQDDAKVADAQFDPIKETYTLQKTDLEGVQPVKEVVGMSTLVLIILFLIAIIMMLLIGLLARRKTPRVFIVIFVLVAIVQAALLGLLNFASTKLQEQMATNVEQAIAREQTSIILELYKQQLTGNILLAVGLMLFLIAACVVVIFLLNKKKPVAV